MFLVEETGSKNKEDIELAEEEISNNTNHDLQESCKWFERVRFYDGRDGTFYVNSLIYDIRNNAKKTSYSRGVIETASSYIKEAGGCAQIMLQHRNRYAHENNYGSLTEKALFNACATRIFQILADLVDLLTLKNINIGQFSKYAYEDFSQSENIDQEENVHKSMPTEALYDIIEKIKDIELQISKSSLELDKKIDITSEIIINSCKKEHAPPKDIIKKTASTNAVLTISPESAENEFLRLRDEIYREMSQHTEFKPYQNILQRPIIRETLKNKCCNIHEFTKGCEFNLKMERNGEGLFLHQIDLWGERIDSILSRIIYPGKLSVVKSSTYLRV